MTSFVIVFRMCTLRCKSFIMWGIKELQVPHVAETIFILTAKIIYAIFQVKFVTLDGNMMHIY